MVRDIKKRANNGAAHAPRIVKKKKKRGRAAAAICLSVVALLAVLAAIGGLYVQGLDTIYPNVRVDGVELGGLTAEEAADILNRAGYDENKNAAVSVLLPMDYSFSITTEEAGVALSSSSVADMAYRHGRESSFFGNFLTYIRCRLLGADLSEAERNLDEKTVRARIEDAVREVNAALMGSELTIGEEYISVVKGARSMTIDPEEIYRLVADAFAGRNWDIIKYNPVVTAEEVLDLQGLYDTVYREPKNAEYDPETKAATQDQEGRSFDIDLAARLWDEAELGDTVIIPLIVTQPEITTEGLNSVLFRDLLGQKSTTLAGSSASRINNISKAALLINGFVLNPGEEFSYNDVVGPRTAARGFQLAGAYSGGRVVTEYGGGICQVSSTLYYTALLANLEITDRTCHYFGVSYLPAGLDATVSWGGPEFKFMNNRDYPIRIEAYTDMTSYTVTVKIWGTNVDGSYVQLTAETWATSDGYGAQSYRWIYDKDGNLIERKAEARSVYHYHVEETESPSPSPSESPTETPPPSGSPSPGPSESPPPTPSTSQPPPTGAEPTPSPEDPTPSPEDPTPTPTLPVETGAEQPPESGAD